MTILLKAFVSFAVLGRRFWAPLLLLPLISSGASATIQFSGWYYTSITGPFAGESALVAAGILYDTVKGTAGAPTYDYIYEVADTGTAPIAAFVGGTGPQGAVLYNSDTSFGLPGLPASGPVSRGACRDFLRKSRRRRPARGCLAAGEARTTRSAQAHPRRRTRRYTPAAAV